MMYARKTFLAAASGALLLGGCATVSGPRLGPELVGQNIRLVPATGEASTLAFANDGTVVSSFGQRSAKGRWFVRDEWLCFVWAGNFQECWPYAAPFARGRTVSITSDRGNVVQATLL